MKTIYLLLLGLAMTASQFRHRQGGTSYLPLCLSNCRGQAHGRWQFICPLPKGVRLPQERSSYPLFSGSAVILLNSRYHLNRDGFYFLHGLQVQEPTAATV